MTSAEIRQSFLDFFRAKQHTIVPSSSLLPDSPNLLFTNAGMNQFVPIFLSQRAPDVSKWAGVIPSSDTRAADTQKCIRAGGKHNDLEDVGLDTYHLTFFEMLGNWSFGDYFKKESLNWGWELLTKVWGIPAKRLFATVYSPDKSKGDPSEFDQEAYDIWAEIFRREGLDPKIHIVYGNKKDNFWMMGDTGPCGPCSEIHFNLLPSDDEQPARELVNAGSQRCIEIWNHVFIQFNAEPDGPEEAAKMALPGAKAGVDWRQRFVPLPAKHVDTGMGFDRIAGFYAGTKRFKDYSQLPSAYDTDIFTSLFAAIAKLSGKKYRGTLPGKSSEPADASRPFSGEHTRPLTGEHTRPRVSQSAPSPIGSGTTEATYSRRNFPHFERPWAKYMVTFSTNQRRTLTPRERDIALESILYAHKHHQYQLYAACVMPDHVHLLFEPQIKGEDKEGKTVFWSLSEILQGIKSASAHNINKASGQKGPVWEKESLDRMIRGQSDLEEKFHYICRNPWDSSVVPLTENYPWLWTPSPANASLSGEHTRPRVSQSAPSPIPSVAGTTPANEELSGSSASQQRDPTAGAQSGTREGACAPQAETEQEKIDIAFRVIADHIRTLSFSIADGIIPSNEGRGYVLRRILRRAVRYGRSLGFHEPFFYKLVPVLAEKMGHVFAEIRAKQQHVEEVIQREEIAFNKTLDKGIEVFESVILQRTHLSFAVPKVTAALGQVRRAIAEMCGLRSDVVWDFQMLKGPMSEIREWSQDLISGASYKGDLYGWVVTPEEHSYGVTALKIARAAEEIEGTRDLTAQSREALGKKLIEAVDSLAKTRIPNTSSWRIGGKFAFVLYDTYGFPLDLTELMAREHGLSIDKEHFEELMDQQKARARAAQKKEVIELSQIETNSATNFVGYEHQEVVFANVLDVVRTKEKTAIVLDTTPFYAEMGGQVGDTGALGVGGSFFQVVSTTKTGNTFLHLLKEPDPLVPRDEKVRALVDYKRRFSIERHHTVTHLLHWALHEVVSKDAVQKGSYVGPEKLTFDFSSAPLTAQQIADVEKLVNERILANAGVSWTEVPYSEVKSRKDIMQFFGEKYGDKVRVVQIGGKPMALDGYSMELCGGTHTRATGEIGLFRIVAESATGAGIRRIEAVAGLEAYKQANEQLQLIKTLAGKINTPVTELEKKIESLLAQQKDLEKQLKSAQQKQAAETARTLTAKAQTIGSTRAIIEKVSPADGDYLQSIADSLKGQFNGVVVLGGSTNGAVALVATVSPDLTKQIQAGKIIQTIAPIVGGKGGGRPDNARGGGKEVGKLDEALAKAKSLLG